MRFLPLSRAALAGAILVAAPAIFGLDAQAWAQLPDVRHQGQVEYVMGGFGQDESDALKQAMADYPLAFTFASSAGGRSAYLSRVRVVIRDRDDVTVLNVESLGPYLLVRLPAGRYQVFATYQNRTQSRSVAVAQTGTARVVFDWPRQAPAAQAPDPDAPRFRPGSIPGIDG